MGSKLFLTSDASLNSSLVGIGGNVVVRGSITVDGDVSMGSKLFFTSDSSLNCLFRMICL